MHVSQTDLLREPAFLRTIFQICRTHFGYSCCSVWHTSTDFQTDRLPWADGGFPVLTVPAWEVCSQLLEEAMSHPSWALNASSGVWGRMQSAGRQEQPPWPQSCSLESEHHV